MGKAGRGRLGRAGALGGVIGGVGIVAGIKDIVSAASDLSEQMSKSNVVFGDSAAAIETWSKTTTRAFGVSQRQAIATASSFGALFAPLGLVGPEAASQAQRLTELGADLASFYNTDVQDALDAIRSGIVGESEPLRRYGALLSETRVQQEALRQTGKKHVTQLTAQEKALARIALIFKDTKKAQGDFARTSDGLANQTRILSAAMDDFKVQLGTALLPTITAVTGALVDFNEAMASPEAGMETFVKGSKLETTLVPALAKQIRDMQKLGKKGPEILAALRARLGDSPKASDLIAEAFVFNRDPKLRSRIKKALDGVQATVNDEVKKGRKRKPPTAAQRNEWFDATIGRQLDRVQDMSLRKQLARLKAIAQEVRARLAITTDATRRLTLEDELLGIYREQRTVQGQITDQIKAANQALKDRADAIKSAVIERLQQRQTDILNKRALQDAREQLRIAKQAGGPMGIRAARRGLQDVNLDILRARIERTPATLGRGGRFQLGGVVINIHGITDPEAVARKVTAILQKRGRRTTTQTRGPSAGSHAGAH